LAEADIVLVVLDSTQPIGQEDDELLQQVEQRTSIAVANKSDLAKFQFPTSNSSLPVVKTSALTGEGIEDLRAAILRQVGGESGPQIEAGFLTNARHLRLVNDSLASLVAATSAISASVPHEMLLLDLYSALRPLDEITGATTTDDILNLIFGSFCIGK
jgi:tRNA modification GTPase